MIKECISKLVEGESISFAEARDVAEEIMTGKATPSQIAAFITSLRIRGESIEAITAFVSVMRAKAAPFKAPSDTPILDTCGTGGDQSKTFNISTLASIISASAGIKVAKHGNRAVSSRCGSADVLESLGVKIDCPIHISEKCLLETNFCFLFAPIYHGAMKYAVEPRRDIGIRTIFNLVGPLSNPARASHQLLGVFKSDLAPIFADVLANLGTKRALIVYGTDMLDEISLSSVTSVAELFEDGRIKTYTINPADFGFKLYPTTEFTGGDREENAKIFMNILKGEKGPKTDITLLNAGAAIYIAERAESIREGIEIAKKAIESGAALDTLEKVKQTTSKAI